MTDTKPPGPITAALTAVQPSPRPEPPARAERPPQGRLRPPAWASVISAALIACGAGVGIGYATAAATIEPETVVIDANATCRDGMSAASRALDARARAAAGTNDVLAASTNLYGAVLTGSDIDIEAASDRFTGTKMLQERQETRARQARAEFEAARRLCPIGW